MKNSFIVEDKTVSLSAKISSQIVSSITKNYNNWNEKRLQQLEDAKIIRDAIYQKFDNRTANWQSNIKLPEIYELAQTFKAHLWENIYSNPACMFDVRGKTAEAQASSNKQKSLLVSAFEDMNIVNELDKAINDIIELGDCVLFVGWETKTKQIRRRNSVKNTFYNASHFDSDNEINSPAFLVDEKVVFDGVRAKAISPENFIFDVSRKDNWENCPKIYKTYATIDEIQSNQVYKASKDVIDELAGMVSSQNGDFDLENEGAVNGNQLEILEYWGDLTLEDGTILRNWLVTVVGKKHIIRFEANPYVANPFIYANLIEDPVTKRGISPLRIALVMNDISSDILNRQLDALSLISNPPYLAPKGSFCGAQEVSPGKIIEYESALMPQSPTPLKFDSALQGWEFLNFFKNTVESSTGIFKNMVGNTESSKRTATEINYTVGGQSTRLNMAIDNISQKIVLPLVECVADMIANFKYGSEIISVTDKGKIEYIEVDDCVRQADYKYYYGDRKATQERKFRFKELFDIISNFAKINDVAPHIDWLECFKYALEQYGIENSDLFLKSVD